MFNMKRFISLLIGIVTLSVVLSGCDNMRPQPIESAVSHLSEAEVRQRLYRSLDRLGYADGTVQANLGRVGMRMELRDAQTYLEALGYYDAPRLGILDTHTVTALEAFVADHPR
ncbi:peptidoglycan-binding protein [Salinispirillum sp. LH 10-3-1]|uniref:Peptidoglycan-binding protein n=1 Tax=Salinispirillum sp. LH 10-3-1 TaxID=2952525 RepID=A0AB38YE87_9GAMM